MANNVVDLPGQHLGTALQSCPFCGSRELTAIDVDTYDGAPDSGNRAQIGYGKTRQEAINELLDILDEYRPVRCASCGPKL